MTRIVDKERFVLEVGKRLHGIICDPSHPFSKNSIREDNAWAEIAAVSDGGGMGGGES